MNEPRVELHPDELRLPDPAIPRPGERVVWFTDALRRAGTYVGHGPNAVPIVRTEEDFTERLTTFDELRLEDPSTRTKPIWHRLGAGQIVRPSPEETAKLHQLLRRRVPPGPSYFEVIEEIWHRGHETFLVGGTVRDVIAGGEAKDVDLVTSMPIERAAPMLARMFRGQPSIDSHNGFVGLGGRSRDGDNIDLKSFVFKEPGTEHAVFAGDFDRDVRHRDFACNAIYYDPINNAFIDPRGCGVKNAEERELVVVADPALRTPFHRATVVIRLAKFRVRGFTLTEETVEVIQSDFLPDLRVLRPGDIISYLRRQLLNKFPEEEHQQLVSSFGAALREIGGEEIWEQRFLPVLPRLLQRRGAK